MLWTSKEENLTTKVPRGEWIKKSGVFIGEIIEAEIVNSNNSKAQAVAVKFKTEDGFCRPLLWFKKADGSENEFATKVLDRMLFLCKLTVDKLVTKAEGSKGTLPILEGKKLGLFLEVKVEEYDGKDSYKYEIRDFFDLKSKKTAEEIKGQLDPINYEWYTNKYKNTKEAEKVQQEAKKNTNQNEEEDEFPF